MTEKKTSSAEYMKIRRYVLNRIHRADGKMTQLPTAQDLAKQFGCSRPTVCKAMKTLIDDGYVIGKPGLGSFINPGVDGMRGGNMSGFPIIGIIFGDGMVVHYEAFFGAILAQALLQLIHIPAVVHIINLTSTNPEKIAKEILAEDLDGLLWENPAAVDPKVLQLLRKQGLPIVTMGINSFPDVDSVYFDMDTLGVNIAELLLAKNRRNVVFLADRKPWNASRDALIRTFAEAGFPLNEKLFLGGCESGLEKLQEFLELGVPVDAVVNPLFLTKKILNIFDSLGIDRNEKCTLVNNGVYMEDTPVPGGIHYELPISEYTRVAVQRLLVLLKNKTLPPEHIPVSVPVSQLP